MIIAIIKDDQGGVRNHISVIRDTVQYITIQHKTAQYNTTQSTTILYKTKQYNTIQPHGKFTFMTVHLA